MTVKRVKGRLDFQKAVLIQIFYHLISLLKKEKKTHPLAQEDVEFQCALKKSTNQRNEFIKLYLMNPSSFFNQTMQLCFQLSLATKCFIFFLRTPGEGV